MNGWTVNCIKTYQSNYKNADHFKFIYAPVRGPKILSAENQNKWNSLLCTCSSKKNKQWKKEKERMEITVHCTIIQSRLVFNRPILSKIQIWFERGMVMNWVKNFHISFFYFRCFDSLCKHCLCHIFVI